MKSTAGRWTLLLGLAMLLGLGLTGLLAALQLDDRLDAFLPPPGDERQALVADQITRGPGATSVIAAIGGAQAQRLADTSRAFARAAADIQGVRRADNAPPDLAAALQGPLLDLYPLLVDDPERYTTSGAVRTAVRERVSELSVGGREMETLIRHDPLGVLPDLAGKLSGTTAPHTRHGVWFDPAGERALLMIDLAGGGFDIDAQTARVEALRNAFAQVADEDMDLVLSGPPVFSADSARAARSDARRLSVLAAGWVLILLALAWRRADRVIAGALPLMAGLLAGLAAVSAGFGAVHGLALAFGFTLLGVAVDYPIHLLAHHPGEARAARRRVIRPLGLGAVSTVIAYAAIWLSASPGLSQLGALSAAGLLAAAGVTLFVLPHLVTPEAAPVWRFTGRLERLPRAAWLPLIAGLAATTVLLVMGTRVWSDDLTRLSPISSEKLARDGELRQALGAGGVRHLIVAADSSREQALRATEAVTAVLAGAREDGLLSGWRAATDLVPSRAEQQRRLAAWRPLDRLADRLESARGETFFRADAFRPFLETLADLEAQIPITPESWSGSPLSRQVDALLLPPDHDDRPWRSLVVPAGLEEPDILAERLAAASVDAELIDLKAVSIAMVSGYRRDMLTSLAAALVLIIALLAWYGRRAALVAALVPSLAAVTVTALIMAWAAGGLSIVHLMAMILVAGIGLDYSLFLHHAGHQRRATLQSLIICAASTGGVFAILGGSSIVMLAQLGNTLALGIALALIFALCSRPAGHDSTP